MGESTSQHVADVKVAMALAGAKRCLSVCLAVKRLVKQDIGEDSNNEVVFSCGIRQ